MRVERSRYACSVLWRKEYQYLSPRGGTLGIKQKLILFSHDKILTRDKELSYSICKFKVNSTCILHLLAQSICPCLGRRHSLAVERTSMAITEVCASWHLNFEFLYLAHVVCSIQHIPIHFLISNKRMADLTCNLLPQAAFTDSFATELTWENLKLLLTKNIGFILLNVQDPSSVWNQWTLWIQSVKEQNVVVILIIKF